MSFIWFTGPYRNYIPDSVSLGSTIIKHQFDTLASGRCLFDIHPVVVATSCLLSCHWSWVCDRVAVTFHVRVNCSDLRKMVTYQYRSLNNADMSVRPITSVDEKFLLPEIHSCCHNNRASPQPAIFCCYQMITVLERCEVLNTWCDNY